MAGRNDVAIAAALQAMAQVVGQQPNPGANDGARMLETFLRNHPPTFKGRYDSMELRSGSKKLKEFSE